MVELLDEGLGNASSVHGTGRRARALIDEARETIADALGVGEDDVLFTSGGTESNNLAILGTLDAAPAEMAVVTSVAEHPAVLEPVARAEALGRRVTRVPIGADGGLDFEALGAAVGPDPTLVSVMAANNEIGSTTNLARVRSTIGEGPDRVLHTDGVQMLGKLNVDIPGWGVDLASFSGHKVGGPVGVGLLIRCGLPSLSPRVFGGAQERGLRPGTENVAAIAATAEAIRIAVREVAEYAERTSSLARLLWASLRARVPDVRLNGPRIDDPDRLPNTLNISAVRGDSRTLVARLDLGGLEVSSGSACASGSLEPSHVLAALPIDSERARSGVRISIGRSTTEADIHTAVETLGRTLGEAP